MGKGRTPWVITETHRHGPSPGGSQAGNDTGLPSLLICSWQMEAWRGPSWEGAVFPQREVLTGVLNNSGESPIKERGRSKPKPPARPLFPNLGMASSPPPRASKSSRSLFFQIPPELLLRVSHRASSEGGTQSRASPYPGTCLHQRSLPAFSGIPPAKQSNSFDFKAVSAQSSNTPC